jgi:hypothetical protein
MEVMIAIFTPAHSGRRLGREEHIGRSGPANDAVKRGCDARGRCYLLQSVQLIMRDYAYFRQKE